MIDEIQPTAGRYPPDPVSQVRPRGERGQPTNANTDAGDRVEISDLAYWRAKLASLPEVRAEKITAIQNQIENNTYQTPEKLDIAVDRLMEDLLSNEI